MSGERRPSGRPARAARVLAWSSLAAAGAGAAALLAGPPGWMLDLVAARHPGCLYRVATERRLVALTIDDAPDPSSTPQILAQLHRHDARATFFIIAEQARGQEPMLHRLVAGGHELGNHFTRDRPSIGLDAEEFARDLTEADRALRRFGPMRWARPGSGWYSADMVAVMEQAGYRCALGSVYPYDATIPWAGFASRFILRNAGPGAIIVLHDRGARGRRTARVLAAVLPVLRARGLRVVTLGELASAAPPNQELR